MNFDLDFVWKKDKLLNILVQSMAKMRMQIVAFGTMAAKGVVRDVTELLENHIVLEIDL